VTISNLVPFHADSLENTLIPVKSGVPQKLLVYFDFDKSDFSIIKYPVEYFEESINYLKQNRKAFLSITGFTDEIGSEDYNRELGYKRAKQVRELFIDNGITTINIMVGSGGESEPAENNNTDYGRSKNRRAEISIKH
jgi:outer membrane protein OmpA-like peptidoglycan-associated protein